MKRFFFIFLVALNANAQDVIVKKDGSTILSKVLEVNQEDIKYKKFSNQNGPTYTINKSEIMSINYENGEKDVFSASNDNAGNTPAATSNATTEASIKKNQDYLNSYNNYSVEYSSDKVGGDAKRAFFTLALSENSVVINDDLSCDITIGQVNLGNTRGASGQPQFSKGFTKGLGYYFFTNQALQITLTNKTSKTIYVDLGNSFYRRGKESSPYYIPKATSSMQSSTTGVSIGIPTFFGSVGVGSSQTHAVSVTTYTQRILAIGPMSSRSLEPEMLFPKDYEGTEGLTVNYTTSRNGYFPIINIGNKQFYNGEVLTYTYDQSPIKIGAYITYGFDENISSPEHLSIDLYAREMSGFPYPSGAAAFCANAEKFFVTKGSPLSFITVINDGSGKNGIMNISK
jgi:hypothetical protein